MLLFFIKKILYINKIYKIHRNINLQKKVYEKKSNRITSGFYMRNLFSVYYYCYVMVLLFYKEKYINTICKGYIEIVIYRKRFMKKRVTK